MHIERLLGTSRLRYIIPHILNDTVLQNIYKRLDQLLSENKTYSKTLQGHLSSGILPAIACYEALSAEYGKEHAYALVHDAVTKYADEYGTLLILFSKTPVFFGILKAVMPRFLNSVYPPDGWDFRWIPGAKDEIAFDAHSCFYVDVFTRYSAGELTKIFCETDDICYKKFVTAGWDRTKTIGRGDELCNFRFYRKK